MCERQLQKLTFTITYCGFSEQLPDCLLPTQKPKVCTSGQEAVGVISMHQKLNFI